MPDISRPPPKIHRFLERVNGLTPAEALTAYIERGKSVFPVGPEKRPLVKWLEFQTRVATPDEARCWLDRWPDLALGFITGAINGFNVLDADSEEAERWLRVNAPPTPLTQRTRRGLHRFYRCGQLTVPTTKGLGCGGIDSRGEGGYVVIAPSVIAGHRYRWEIGSIDPPVPTLDSLGADFFIGSGGASGGNHGTHLQGQVYDPDTGLIIDGRESYLTSLVMGVVATFVRRYEYLPEAVDVANEAWGAFTQRADLSDGKYSYGLCLEKAAYAVRRVGAGTITISDDDGEMGDEERYEKWA